MADGRMLKLIDASVFLNLHPNTVRNYAVAGKIPAAKIGRDWRFIRADLEAFVRDGYKRDAPVLPSAEGKDEQAWHSTTEAVSGTSRSQARTEHLLDTLLTQPTGARQRNTTTG